MPAVVLERADNVATAVEPITRGTTAFGHIAAREDIPFGFKIALRPIPAGEAVVKYGIPIARATRDIRPGERVHIHNACSLVDLRSADFDAHSAAPQDMCYTLPGEEEQG